MSTPAPLEGTFIATEDEPYKPPRFDPYRIASTDAMRALVDEVIGAMLRTEAHFAMRKRARRPRDARVFRETVEALVCDLAYQHLTGHPAIRVPRSEMQLARKSRYTSDLLNKQLPAILDLLDKKMGLITQQIGSRSALHSHQTEVAPQTWLTDRFSQRGLTIYDTDRREGEELVLLRGDKVQGLASLVEYNETELTTTCREEVRTINRYLRDADIHYHGDVNGGLLVDPRKRYMRRFFSRESFLSGGRLFGGFWQDIGKEDRLENTYINGEPVVSLDFKAMIAALAYAYVGMPSPETDAYTLPPVHLGSGESRSYPRKHCKKLFSSLLFHDAGQRLREWPRKIPSNDFPLGAVVAAIETAHQPIAPLFYKGLGHSLMYTESEILVDCLLQLVARDIPALPLHDCLVVPESACEVATRIMQDTFQFHTGQTAAVVPERAE